MLVDTHAHLYWDVFEKDLEQVVQRALDTGVTEIINVGVDVNLSKTAANLKSPNPQVKFYSSIGIHPHEAVKYINNTNESIQKDMEELEKIAREHFQKVIAVGECGLDYLFDPKFIPPSLSIDQIKKLQKKLFLAQIDLAKKLGLPLLVHCRDDRSKDSNNTEAWNQVLEMIFNHPSILHCYSGLLATTQKVLPSPNLLISFAATLTYPKNDYLIDSLKLLPLERIVLETDSPFLPPQNKRGQRNEPSTVREIAQFIAEIKAVSLEEVVRKTSENTRRLLKT